VAESVSGPGRLSKRTDRQPVRQLTDAAYGEQASFRQAQQGAPMVNTANPATAMPAAAPGAGVVPLDAPTERPGEPVTAGAPVGAGPGPEVLGLPNPRSEAQELVKYLPMLERRANSPESSQTLRNIVQYLKGLA
jgi:hypothetical protein